ncbi:MAG: serine/threonine-protein kinase, partial [Pseudomonadota bacterium]
LRVEVEQVALQLVGLARADVEGATDRVVEDLAAAGQIAGEQQLLAADQRDVDLEAPVAAGVAALTAEREDPWVGRAVGAWTIVRRIAAGGMGAVFLAERTDKQLNQQAAIKIMTAQLLAEDATARFRAERQILASLDHRFIARLLDGGSTDTRLPYLVMEYVDGLPVDAYCDQQRLGIDERLRLFVNICDAVGYAHRNLIVHRDLKPSNILVNADGEPRLLDFGIAKLLEGSVDVGTVAVTRQGMRVMTPEYASPEQVTGRAVTIATDIYALGVLLYRLLSGHHPYAQELTTSVSTERAICETDPRPPSARSQHSDDNASADDVAQLRRTTAPRLARALRGDLDNIVLKAMRKEPEQRYESVRHFADDVERYLNREPVRAHPPDLTYRLSKFLRRNTGPVIASALALTLFVSTVFFYTVRVTRERDRAQLETAKAQQVSEFVAGLFRTANPDESLGELITARQLLDQGVRRLDELSSQPEVQAAMQDVIGTAYQGLGLFDTSIDLLREAGATRERILGPSHRDTLGSLTRLGDVLTKRGRLPESEALFRDALSRASAVDSSSMETARATHGLALALSAQSRFDEAGEHFAQALTLMESAQPADGFALAALLDDYGRYLGEIYEEERAIPMIRRAIALFKEVRGDGHPSYLNALQNLGYALIWTGSFQDAAEV